ncbi:MAG: glycosyltransferase [Campylobacteraceae bacterium]|jgi:glycosyltransferase involved in cell wall biosynthesis|nr:glycosyltransferase [Campylobacteraceae bacterium]
MKMPLVSVIVPIYNVEVYLKKCVDSIINQTHKNLEIILVDDGSPDNCGKICDEYAAKDKRIRVIHKPNGGLGDARNAGLDIAKGEYIAFVDSDDYIAENAYEELINTAKKEAADIVISGFYYVKKSGIFLYEKSLEGLNKEEILYQFLSDNYHSSVCNKFFKAKLFKELRFTAIRFEDLFIMPSLILAAKKISFTPKAYYYYLHTNETSLTSSKDARNKYGLFMAWAEHERLGRLYLPDICALSEYRAARSAAGAVVINAAHLSLTQKEINNCEEYLRQKHHIKIGVKYRFLLRTLKRCPYICKLYCNLTLCLHRMKKTVKRQKEKK